MATSSVPAPTPFVDIRFKTPPHAKQVEFMNAAEKEQLFGGAKRGGKSHGLSQKITMLSQVFPGNRGLLYRQSLTDLKDSTLVTFFETCPSELIAQHHKGDRKVIFRNGSHFIYRGIGDKDELEKVKGIDLGWMAGDEPTEVEEDSYLMLFAQLNWKLPNGQRPAYMSLLASNPEPGWVKKRFIDPLEKDPEGNPVTFKATKDRIFIPSRVYDNPYLPPGYIQFLLDNFPAEWVIKYVRGSWEISEGMVFKELDRKTHVVDFHPPIGEMKLYASLDHATTGVTCFIVIGITANHDYFVIREYYQKDRLVSEHAVAIRAIITELKAAGGELEYILIDPATNQRSSQGNYQLKNVQELYTEEGINTISAWNTIEAGVERLKMLIHPSPTHFHYDNGLAPAPHFYICSWCRHTWDEFQGWKKEVDQYGYVKYKGTDHAIDNCRYIAISRPKPPSATYRDETLMGPGEAFASRTHRRWVERFDKQVRRQQGLGGNSYF